MKQPMKRFLQLLSERASAFQKTFGHANRELAFEATRVHKNAEVQVVLYWEEGRKITRESFIVDGRFHNRSLKYFHTIFRHYHLNFHWFVIIRL